MHGFFPKQKLIRKKKPDKLITRLKEIKKQSHKKDEIADNEFQKWAWDAKVLRFLNSAKRNLDWEHNQTDRTLMGFILTSVHARKGDGISNQMQKSRALGPDYSVRWWKAREMYPPSVCPVNYFTDRINWRYRHGTIKRHAPAKILFNKAEDGLRGIHGESCDLLFTSPPYYNVTSYLHDSWIRLWVLNKGESLPNWQRDKNIHCMNAYTDMMKNVFEKSQRILKKNATVWIRTDARKFTQETTKNILLDLWGEKNLYYRADIPNKKTQTSHFGHTCSKIGEIDFLISHSHDTVKSMGFDKLASY